jgi:hypothetical protein
LKGVDLVKKNKKVLALVGLLALCVVIVAGVIILRQSPKDTVASGDSMKNIDPTERVTPTAEPSVAPSAIPSPAPIVVKPRPIPTPTPTPAPTVAPSEPPADTTVIDLPLTVIEDKPTPPEAPDTAPSEPPEGDTTPEDVKKHEALDPVLKDPDKKPEVTPEPVEPDKPKEKYPENRRREGEIYVPGFGWIKDEGGGGQMIESQMDPEHTDFEKQVGY